MTTYDLLAPWSTSSLPVIGAVIAHMISKWIICHNQHAKLHLFLAPEVWFSLIISLWICMYAPITWHIINRCWWFIAASDSSSQFIFLCVKIVLKCTVHLRILVTMFSVVDYFLCFTPLNLVKLGLYIHFECVILFHLF